MIENKVEKKIMWGDLDSLGIVFYPRYYEWIDGCSHLFFEKISFDLIGLWTERQVGFSLIETFANYFSPGRYHQDIVILTRIGKLQKKAVTIHHTIMDKASEKMMVRGYEKRVCIDARDPGNFKAMEIPDDVCRLFRQAM
ncbi:acyl-CoA thioesterase [Desulfobacter sp.]